MTIYKLTGTVTAADGSEYDPIFYGTLVQCNRVLDAIAEACNEQGDLFNLSVRPDRPDFDIEVDPPTIFISNRGPVAA